MTYARSSGPAAVPDRRRLVGPGGRVVQGEHRGVGARQHVARLRWTSTTGAAASVEHEGQPVGRVLRVQRQVGAAGLEHAEQAGDQLDGAFRADPDQRLRADARRAQPVRHPVRGRRPAARTSSARPRSVTATASGVGRACSSIEAVQRLRRQGSRRRCRSRPPAAPARGGKQVQLPRPPRPGRRHRAQQGASSGPAIRSTVARSNRSVLKTSLPQSPSAVSHGVQLEVEPGRPQLHRRQRTSTSSPATAVEPAHLVVLHHEHGLEHRRAADVAGQPQLVRPPAERHLGGSKPSSTLLRVRPSSSAKVGSPASSARIGSMLMNMPTRFSSSGADRPATDEPTAKSSWPACRASSAGTRPAASCTAWRRARRPSRCSAVDQRRVEGELGAVAAVGLLGRAGQVRRAAPAAATPASRSCQ